MASARNDSSASAGLPSAGNASDDPRDLVEKLSEELSLHQAVLASLHDLPKSISAKGEIADIRAAITDIKLKLTEARDRGYRQIHDPSTLPSNPNPMDSSPGGEGYGSGSGVPPRKRSIGSSHLDADPSNWGAVKSRRTTPSPGPRGFGSGFGDFDDDNVIDLTGDDDSEWRSVIQRQKEEVNRASRIKAEADRDAAFARQLDGRPSPPPNRSTFAPAPHLGQNNAFNRILGRSSQVPSWTPGRTDHIKQEPGPALATRPHASVKNEPGPFPAQTSSMSRPGSFTVKPEPAEHKYRVPGAYEESEDEDIFVWDPRPRPGLPRPSLPSLSSSPSLNPYNQVPTVPTLPSMKRNPGVPPNGFVPAIELARQSSMARQGDSPAWQTVGKIGRQLNTGFGAPEYPLSSNGYSSALAQHSLGGSSLGANRPGFMANGNYYPHPGHSAFPNLTATLNGANGFDWTDGEGNALGTRITDYVDDLFNDPRKTEADIQQLLSNIRPDMEVPEEERGETPEAMRYPLYVHQQLALKWMTDMEEGTNKGGILADDMGLGKTISTLALMVTRPSSDIIKTNLIIGPVALIKQWELEVKKKLKGTHKLSVLLLHSKKKPYSEIKNKFYRVILDEAQCVKNKDTQGSRAVHQINATYRWCLTGTPMMNGVSELYPLIRFLKIRPYCDFNTFQKTFKGLNPKSNASDYTRDNAMRQLQAVLKAMMLRRMKNSMIDGKPLVALPPKTENSEEVTFSDDERQFYQDLETRSQVQFNKYLRAGTVGKNYSNILVLLLRLRQACCHPHLTDFECKGAAASDTDMMALAKELNSGVIARIKAIEAFECPICYDGVQDPLLVIPCGHDTCTECFTSLTENNAQANIRSGDENGAAKCPVCRGPVDPTKVITLTAFRKVHAPEALPPEDAATEELPVVTDSDDSDDSDDSLLDSDTEPDADLSGNLAGFVVPDGEVEGVEGDDIDDAQIDAELDAVAHGLKKEETKDSEAAKEAVRAARKLARQAKKSRKAGGKAKAKPKAEEIKPHMLKQLRTEADKNKEARRRYMHYLRDNWQDSAKVSKVIELLEQIQETDEKTIIFSQWTALLDMIECQIKDKLNLRYCRYTGKMSRNQRDEAVQDFCENPRNRVMLVSLRAGNAGLNLTVASRIIICDPFWNPFIEAQAVDRAHRIGQQREVQVHRILVKETVEDRILALQENKRRLVEAALDEGQSKTLGRLSERELAYLFGVNPARR
ncbi:P-loop containing nucleoside triphosphate hydrolase protein [Chaetomidium leptoderma]|uniref:P-loop containing nucleoside triphosphate hydrolase protein n=1 Tax=Chaetomidium leptoderma TaxID=669021 RepID=A0AAN6ZX77_9PEZI|nr:P-loop containing nucleoside triphosphate hydrolase protein [Chaetomidium leptoderma]